MCVDSQPRVFSHQGTASAGMIQVDVGKKEGVEISDVQAVPGQLFAEVRNSGRWPWINQRHAIAETEQGRSDRAAMAGPAQIENGCRYHE